MLYICVYIRDFSSLRMDLKINSSYFSFFLDGYYGKRDQADILIIRSMYTQTLFSSLLPSFLFLTIKILF